MPDVKPLADDLSSAPLCRPEELADLAPEFRTIINNRPDGGGAGPAELGANRGGGAAAGPRLCPPAGRSREDHRRAGRRVRRSDRPAAKARSSPSAALARVRDALGAFPGRQRSPDEIIGTAATAGYDLRALKAKLEDKAALE